MTDDRDCKAEAEKWAKIGAAFGGGFGGALGLDFAVKSSAILGFSALGTGVAGGTVGLVTKPISDALANQIAILPPEYRHVIENIKEMGPGASAGTGAIGGALLGGFAPVVIGAAIGVTAGDHVGRKVGLALCEAGKSTDRLKEEKLGHLPSPSTPAVAGTNAKGKGS